MTHHILDEAALRRSVRTLITVADNVRRGALPARALTRIVSADVAADIVAELPPSPGVSAVNTVHLQQPTATKTYFTGSAIRPDGTAVAYLGLATRDAEQEPWQVTQVLPVSERTIGRPADGRIRDNAPDQVAAFRSIIISHHLDAAVELLGPIPDPRGQRLDWIEAATAIVHHAHTAQLPPPQVVDDLTRDVREPTETWRTATAYIDAYRTSYDIDITQYRSFEDRLEAMRGHTTERRSGPELEADR